MTDRYSEIRAIAKQQSLDAIALVPGANFTRLFNKDFHQNERPLVVVIPVEGEPLAVVPNLELGSFAKIGFEGEVFDWRDQTGYQAAFDHMLQKLPIQSVGVEGQVMRVFVDQALRAANPELVISDQQRAIASLRLCKTPIEIEALKNAIRISETALHETLAEVRIGMTETAIESILVQRLFANGAEAMSFSPIVAAGTNSAKPHASARDDYAIKAGDTLLIDFGGRYAGLCADITRTFFVDHCTDQHAAIYDTVLNANLAGIAASRAGATAHDVDDATTRVLEQSAYVDRIRHKTGHGLGRDIHEDPYIMRGNKEALAAGMVFTIEPGLYDLDDMGVRIEDDVLITDAGCDILTSVDKTLTIVGQQRA